MPNLIYETAQNNMENNANSNEETIVDANANLQETNQGTQEMDNSTNQTIDNVASTVDYQKKFSESSKEALRLVELQKEKDAEIERLNRELELRDNGHTNVQNTDNLYPGYEDLDEDARKNLIAYTNTVTNKAKQELYKDPAIAFAVKQYNEQKWDSAFNKAASQFPELAQTKDEFKSKYYNVNNVPENIDSILVDIAKIHLFDKAKQIGVKETEEKQNRIEVERTTAGAKDTTAKRSLEDWMRMSKENPSEFAKNSKQFNEDLASGKI